MFRAAYRSSSGALTVFAASGLHTHVATGRSQVLVGTGHTSMLIPYELFPIQSHNQHGQLISEQNPGELNPLVQLGLNTIQTHVTTWSIITGTITKPVPTQTWLRPVATCVCKLEAANIVRAPDDERYAARNMLSLQWTVE